MTYNRSKIMQSAWASVRRATERGSTAPVREIFRRCLRCAWLDAKIDTRVATAAPRDGVRAASSSGYDAPINPLALAEYA